MKRLYVMFMVLVLGSLLTACSASSANIQGADMGTGFDSASGAVTGATTTFDKAAPAFHCVIKVANVPDGTTVKAVWTAVDVTSASGAATKDRKLDETSTTLKSDGSYDSSLKVPATGEWPVGSYKVEVYLNDKLDRTVNFTVH